MMGPIHLMRLVLLLLLYYLGLSLFVHLLLHQRLLIGILLLILYWGSLNFLLCLILLLLLLLALSMALPLLLHILLLLINLNYSS